MSEYIRKTDPSVLSLTEFARGLMTGEDVRELIRKHRQSVDNVTPLQAMEVLDNLIAGGFRVTEVKASVGKILNVFYKSLNAYQWEKPGEGHFIHHLMLENRAVEKRIAELRELTKLFFNGKTEDLNVLSKKMLDIVSALKEYELHYIKKENILFPYIEKIFPSYRCLQVMWSFHDDFRHSIRSLGNILSVSSPPRDSLNKELGRLFFTVLPVIFREEHIVFPVALRYLPQEAWDEMIIQARPIGWCYIEPPVIKPHIKSTTMQELPVTDLGTGSLSREQLILMLDTLPVDITFVDENDIVRYFSGARHRIFPRTKAIIGREVQNCHPPDSVNVVEEILAAFRERRRDHADFWINMHGRFIHIRYFALYDGTGTYKGTIEVSQDATEIKELDGERRLLDWDNDAGRQS
jgi:hypothetical protein